jgi:hypothetical protein
VRRERSRSSALGIEMAGAARFLLHELSGAGISLGEEKIRGRERRRTVWSGEEKKIQPQRHLRIRAVN